MLNLNIQTGDFDQSKEYAALRAASDNVGAIVTFTGLVRDVAAGLQHIFLEHYPGMTEQVIKDIAREAENRWSIDVMRIVHRTGKLAAGEQIVFVGVSSAHRADAYAACEFVMDQLKCQATLWKKEVTESGETWLDAKPADLARAARWDKQ